MSWGDFGGALSHFVEQGKGFADQKRQAAYQEALEKQWLAQIAARTREEQQRAKEFELERHDRNREAEVGRLTRAGEIESQRRFELERDAQLAKSAQAMVDRWVDAQRWESEQQKERARQLGYSAVAARSANPIAVLDDAEGRIKPVDPTVALQRQALTEGRLQNNEDRALRQRERLLRGTVEGAAGYLKRYGAPTDAQAIASLIKTNPSFKKGDFDQREIDQAIGNFLGTESGRARPQYSNPEDPYAGMSEGEIADQLMEEAAKNGLTGEDFNTYVDSRLRAIRAKRSGR